MTGTQLGGRRAKVEVVGGWPVLLPHAWGEDIHSAGAAGAHFYPAEVAEVPASLPL